MSAAPAPANADPAPAAPAVEEMPGFKVFAGNLAYSTTDDTLKAFFAPVASDILSAQVILRGTRSAGYGFVAFKDAASAEKAVSTLHKKELDGREVIVELAKAAEIKEKERSERRASKKAGRRGEKAPNGEVTEAEANGEARVDAAKSEGDAVKPKKKKSPRKKKAAKVVADDTTEAAAPADGTPAPAAAAAPAEGEKKKKEKTPKAPRKPKVTRPAGEAPEGEPSKKMLFVANLGFTIDDAGLAALFTDAGIHVNSARVVRRRWGQPRRSKGYGFVDVGSEEEQKKAIAALQGKEVANREIAVKVAVDSRDKDSDAEGGADAPAVNAAPVAAAAE